MLSRKQIILIKRAQRQAGIADADYRNDLEQLCDVRSSKDPKLTDGQFDQIMAYFEAIYWREKDKAEGQRLNAKGPTSAFSIQPLALPFLNRGYWANKNPKHNTSRDRYDEQNVRVTIAELEAELIEAGVTNPYCEAIKRKVGNSLRAYAAALRRTLYARRKYADVPMERRPF